MSDDTVVIQSLDRTGQPVKIAWFANERAFYDDNPIIVLEYDARLVAWNVLSCRTTPRPVMATFGPVWRRLSNFPTADVSKWLTHTVAEPGAPLEPITREQVPA